LPRATAFCAIGAKAPAYGIGSFIAMTIYRGKHISPVRAPGVRAIGAAISSFCRAS
jgi:hypothetical protein